MTDVFALVGYCLVAIFGIFLAAAFCGIPMHKDNLAKLAVFSVASLLVQGLCYSYFGLDVTRWVYPLILHLPLVCFFVFGFQKSWTMAATSLFLAYLCCQIPRWLADLVFLLSKESLLRDILYMVAIPTIYGFLHRFAAKPLQKIMSRSSRSAWGLGLFPFLYYIFDYTTTVYTDALYSGDPYVAQIMPSIMSVGYILFALIYHSQLEKQEKTQQERFLLSLQLRRSQAEYTALRQMQEQADRFHHDLRHHTALLTGYAEKGSLPEIKAYLQDLQQELDSVTFKRFCGHSVVDLLLSHFESRAKSVGVQLAVSVDIPSTLPFKDTELCSILSNALENAIHACSLIHNASDKVVSICLSVRQRNLLLSVQNPYQNEITFADGIPVSKRSGHGLGTRSIVSIVQQHGGLVHFSAEDGVFLLRASLPMD